MEWALALVAVAVLAVAAVSRRIQGTAVTSAILFVGFGLLVGPEVLGAVDLSSTGSVIRVLAEATLALMLFADASRIELGQLRRTVGIPLRLLGIGLPLTILAGAVAAGVVFGQLTIEEALIVGIVLAPTDAALGQAVVTETRVPERIRQALNVESGLNDGIAFLCCSRPSPWPTSSRRSPAAAAPAHCCWRRSATASWAVSWPESASP